MRATTEPRIVALSIRLYGALLCLYPAAYRRARGHELRQVFAEHCRAAYARSGARGVALWWLQVLRGLVKAAVGEHVDELREEIGERSVNIHDPRVQRESGTTLKRALYALLCFALMQMATAVMVGAEHSSSSVIELIAIVGAGASIALCFVATARELWAVGRLGKALLDSAR